MLNVLGIDIGSVAVSVALLSAEQKVVATDYRLHQGAVRQTLVQLLKKLDLTHLGGIAATSSTTNFIRKATPFNNQLSIIAAVKKYHPDVRTILVVGGENFGRINFKESGEYESYKTNSTCAVGTGSFLDQQVSRLNLKDIAALADIAYANQDALPPIASRCAVFAKTDLIHAQQEGYSLGQICDSLCKGLVDNITDTLFGDEKVRLPLAFVGGVCRNKAVVKHLQARLGAAPVISEHSHVYGAIGAALLFLAAEKLVPCRFPQVESLLTKKKQRLAYGYPPLELKLSVYPDFQSLEKFNYLAAAPENQVEVDIYRPLAPGGKVYLGLDIGSTSTKAVILTENKEVLAGFYTRTAGQPLPATQLIFEAIDDIFSKRKSPLEFLGVATTGAGRKFVGKIIGADLMIDEITAHARAAFELDPAVDTIIEIGGQDSKFTTLRQGMVTFCVMNNVCAAGTGSFIEEHARKMGCPLNEYSLRAEKKPSPVSSDRCTVFMERDINYFLGEGYSDGEILASVLHSVRDNYLTKVVGKAKIGERIFFQGATAKNKALVAAFENKLQKPIQVSPYCHLTGALGGALMLAESNLRNSKFRGLSLYKEDIPVTTEICGFCPNQCKIKKVIVQNEVVAFGFLCGRDYDSQKFVASKGNSFDLIKEYQRLFKVSNKPQRFSSQVTIGIPYGLYLAEEMALWTYFFNRLGVKTIACERLTDAVKLGRQIAKTGFCTPVTAFFGHIKHLAPQVDYLFLPVYLEAKEKEKDVFRQYCYYTQYAVSMASSLSGTNIQDRLIMPVIDSNALLTKIELCRALTPLLNLNYWSIVSAYDEAWEFYKERKVEARNVYQREKSPDDINIVILGRPYVVLDPNMNKGIPGIFTTLNTRAFYHEMLENKQSDSEEIRPLLKAFHWNYTAKILETALTVAKTKGCYPVYMSSFKCSPDAFALEYFKRIMAEHQKPYMILDLDEHGSNVGYETRIEAALRAFRNHFSQQEKPIIFNNSFSVNPSVAEKIGANTLLLPSWDNMTVKLVEAVLIKEGIDARMVPLTEQAIQLGLKANSGQCLPVSIIYQSVVDYVENHNLRPEATTVWMLNSHLACNIRLYPYLIKSMFESYGRGLEEIAIYAGSLSLFDISLMAGVNVYFAYMFGGMLKKMGCRLSPYEKEKGSVDIATKQAEVIFYEAFLGKNSLEAAAVEVVRIFKNIRVKKIRRPKVAIFGDLYVRDNELMNQHLIHSIEKAGGEALTTPLSDLAKMVTNKYVRRWLRYGHFREAFASKGIMMLAGSWESNYYKYFHEILREEPLTQAADLKYIMETFKLVSAQAGESTDNLIKIFSLLEHYSDISLFVQASPAFCCAGLVTEAMSAKIEAVTGIPIVSLTYDGTEKNQNDQLIPYIKLLKSK